MADPSQPKNLSAFWPNFNDASVYDEIVCDYGIGSLATTVLNYYGIDCDETIGGQLEDLDIRHMDALTLVKLSLLQDSAEDDKYYEPIMNHGENKVEFKAVGTYPGGVEDIYYTIATMNYIEECTGVMVTGKKPLPERKVANWKPIWGNIKLEDRIFDTSDMRTGCNTKGFSQYATIVFNEPHLTTGQSGYEDGLDNLYEHGGSGDDDLGPFDNIIGYVKFKDPGQYATNDTEITYSTSSQIPIRIGHDTGTGTTEKPYVGKTLAKHPTFKEDLYDPACWDDLNNLGSEAKWKDGVFVPVPELFRFTTAGGVQKDNFLGISKIYFLGIEIDVLDSRPKDEAKAVLRESVTDADGEVWASINNANTVILELDRGMHWEVAYDTSGKWKQPYIVFADNGEYDDPMTYGNNRHFYLTKTSAYYDEWGDKKEEDTQTVIPLGSTKGFIVKEIWAVADLETPSVIIYDPQGGGGGPWGDVENRAMKIAEEFDYQIAPLILTEDPAPIGYNGRLLDQSQHIKDNDPTTAQNFEETDLNEAMDEMSGGSGLSLNLSFLEAEQVKRLSGVLYEYMNGRDGQETVYTCGPNIEPQLGGYGPNGGIINQINYSYTDSQAYTISVNEGPRLAGQMAQIAVGPHFKASEDVGKGGIITDDLGNHIHYMVRLDNFGERIAINSCEEILRIGDRVNCTVNNVPVEA